MDIRAALVALAVVAAPSLAAGQSGGVWRLPATSGGTAAVEAKPQPQVVVVPGQPTLPGHHRVYPRYPSGYTIVPALLLADGRVFANFGFGYEPVYRACSGGVVVGQPQVIGGNGAVLSPRQPVTYTQPVPNQQTASQQMLSGAVATSTVSSVACYSRDGAGRLFVYRF